MLEEQETVGMRRAVRQEMEELTGKKKAAATIPKEERMAKLHEKEAGVSAQPRHTARPGKPLKR